MGLRLSIPMPGTLIVERQSEKRRTMISLTGHDLDASICSHAPMSTPTISTEHHNIPRKLTSKKLHILRRQTTNPILPFVSTRPRPHAIQRTTFNEKDSRVVPHQRRFGYYARRQQDVAYRVGDEGILRSVHAKARPAFPAPMMTMS